MIDAIIGGAIRFRALVIIAFVALLGFGIYSATQLKLAAFPDVTPVQVQITTEAPGLAALEVEKLITFPIEDSLSGLPGLAQIRSISNTGLSVVTVVFDDGTDIYFARQQVAERLQTAKDRIPNDLGSPDINPPVSGLGKIYNYVLTSSTLDEMELRTINDWIVKFQLRTVPGVADVLSFGGSIKQYQVQVDPNRLLSYDLTLGDVDSALKENNANAGGWYLEGQQDQLVIRGQGLIRGGRDGITDIENIVLKSVDGIPVYVRDVATVEFGPEIRQGAASKDGKGEVVMGVVLQLRDANTNQVINDVRKKVEEIQKTLPEGVSLEPVYDQGALIRQALSTVTDALGQSAILIVIVLLLFLWNMRSAVVVLCSIPFSMLIAVVMMRAYGLSANLQSLAGLAISIGMMVDGSLVMVENIVRHLAEPHHRDRPLSYRVTRAASEVGRPIFFAVLIIVVVFLPLFTLQGVEGKLFSPMAFVVAFAMLGSLIVALTLVPVLATVLFPAQFSEDNGFVVRGAKRIYRAVLGFALAHRWLVVLGAVAGVVATLLVFPLLGTEFVPELEEGTLLIRVTADPSISRSEALRITNRLEQKLKKYPEVTYAISQSGRSELGGEPEALNHIETWVGLKPQSQWTTATTREELIKVLSADLSEHPGVAISFSQPIANEVEELLSGVKAEVAIKLFGDDLGVLKQKGRQIERVVAGLHGAADVQMEQISGESQIVVQADRDEIARHGLNVADVMNVVSTAIGGKAVTKVLDGQRQFAVYLRVAEPFRSSIDSIGRLWVTNTTGTRVPLSSVATISVTEGPPSVFRENAQRRVVILANVRGRDLGGFVQEGQQLVAEKVKLPPGYFITWGGQYENQLRAQRTLMIVVPICLALIFILLEFSFGSVRNALLIILNVPFALIGGVFALLISGQFLSVPASVGFIALFGVAVLNGVVLVSYFNQLLAAGYPIDEAVRQGAMLRLRPVLMTATVASLGLIPLLLSTGIGSEVQRPLATVVVGGLVTSTLLTLVVLPVLFSWFPTRGRTLERLKLREHVKS
jgi:heavy metal efflux system protein